MLTSPSLCAALQVGQQTGVNGEGKPLLAGVQVGPSAGRGCTMPSASIHQQVAGVRLCTFKLRSLLL